MQAVDSRYTDPTPRESFLRRLAAGAALAGALIAAPAAGVEQVDGGTIPEDNGGVGCPPPTSNVDISACLNENETALGGAGDLDKVDNATIAQETFNPDCNLTFKVLARGASFNNVFGWYEVRRDGDGNPIKPALNQLHVFLLDTDNPDGDPKTLEIPDSVQEIGFFLANRGSNSIALTPDPLGATLAEEPQNLFFS